jgi:hypothetical protein
MTTSSSSKNPWQFDWFSSQCPVAIVNQRLEPAFAYDRQRTVFLFVWSSCRNSRRIKGGHDNKPTPRRPNDCGSAPHVFADRRFIRQQSTSALEIAEHLLAQAAAGERDLDRLRASALARLSVAA